MRVLFATGHPHLPQFSGGSQSSIHELVLEFIRHNHEAAVLAALWSQGYIGFRDRIMMKVLRTHVAHDTIVGYPVFRKWFVWEDMAETLQKICPDVAIVHAIKPVLVAQEIAGQGVPTIIYWRDVQTENLGGNPRDLPSSVRFIANSYFTAGHFKKEFGIESTVIPPLCDPDRYNAARIAENVTFVNPAPKKGLEVALEIAKRCYDIPFTFVESWPLDPKERVALRNKLRDLPNVTFRSRTEDMRDIYARAKIVLMPSQWQEAWGRVATEAHFSGIPVVASKLGGLPESVGPGGTLIEPNAPPEVWVEAVRALWFDAAIYKEKSAAALAFAGRQDIDCERQFDKLLEVISETIAQTTSCRAVA